jgi:hypothetical protein
LERQPKLDYVFVAQVGEQDVLEPGQDVRLERDPVTLLG